MLERKSIFFIYAGLNLLLWCKHPCMSNTPETNFQTANKDPYMRWIIKIVLTLIVVFIIILLLMVSCGRYVNLWGLEVNKKSDTLYKFSSNTVYKVRYDTIIITKYINSNRVSSKGKITDTTKSNSGKYSFSGNTFNAPTMVGENNTQNYFDTKLPPRVISTSIIQSIIASNSLNLPYNIIWQGGESETHNVFTAVRDSLKKRGFQVTDMQLMYSPEGPCVNRQIEGGRQGNTFVLKICYQQ
jgi:hypothetical protein